MKRVAVDADTIAYKACFATQFQTYHFEEQAWRYKRDLAEFFKLSFDEDERPDIDADVEKVQVVEPLNHTFHIVNEIIKSIGENTGCDALHLFLSGDGNYRKSIPYPVTYKGGRPEKPLHLQEVRDYLVNKFYAVLSNGMEADDALGIFATENPGCILAFVDKDIKQVPGKHYNLDSREFSEVSELEGLKLFYKQMLTGDRADNILGIEGIGPKTAEKLIDKLATQEQMENVTRQKYKEFFKDEWYQMYRSNTDLLRILRSKEELEEVTKEYGKDSSIKEGQGQESSKVGEGLNQGDIQSTRT